MQLSSVCKISAKSDRISDRQTWSDSSSTEVETAAE